jgi:hypothetical protein
MHILEDFSSGLVDYGTFGYEHPGCRAEVQIERELWQPVTISSTGLSGAADGLFRRLLWQKKHLYAVAGGPSNGIL